VATIQPKDSHHLAEVYKVLLQAAKRKEQLPSPIESSIQCPVKPAEVANRAESGITYENANFLRLGNSNEQEPAQPA